MSAMGVGRRNNSKLADRSRSYISPPFSSLAFLILFISGFLCLFWLLVVVVSPLAFVLLL